MARQKSTQPTEVELQILRILWEIGPCGVGEIHRQLQEFKKTNYSTTVKMLAVMRDKKLVSRNESLNPHQYRAAITQARAQKSMLNDLISKVYDGSAASLVLHALASKKATPDEIAEIEQLIKKMKRGDKK